MESLESRKLLSAYVPESLPQYFGIPPNTGGLQGVSGASENFTFVFYSSYLEYPSIDQRIRGAEGAFIYGVLTGVPAIPGCMSGDTILGANDNGTIVGAVMNQHTINEPVGILERFIVRSGVRTSLADAVTQVVGGVTPDYLNIFVSDVGNDGSILFTDTQGAATPTTNSWVFKDGVLTFLWNGSVADINMSGTIVGAAFLDGASVAQPVVRSPAGVVTELLGWQSVGGINDAGVVSGIGSLTGLNQLVKWQDGTTTVLGSPVEFAGIEQDDLLTSATASDINDRGDITVQVTHRRLNFVDWTTADLVYSTDAGFYKLLSGNAVQNQDRLFKPGPNGDIMRYRSALELLSGTERWQLKTDSPLSSTVVDGKPVVVGLNRANEVIAFGPSGERWQVSPQTATTGLPTFHEVLAYTDPVDGRAYAMAFGPGTPFFAAVNPATPTDLAQLGTLINTEVSILVTPTGQVILAGVSDPTNHQTFRGGHVMIRYKADATQPSSPTNWVQEDLTEDHIEASGQTFIPVAGGLTTFATSWGANNIVYLDRFGNIQAIWWAPGMDLWRTDNLSASAGAPAIHGLLKSFTTSWNAMNIIGTDDNGRPVALWWVPGMTGWQYASQLTSQPDSPALDPNSLVVYTTPWNAMNIVGRDAITGRTISYWWVPGFVEWHADELSIPARPEGVVTTGELSGGMTGPNQTIFGRESSTGHLIEIFWTPGAPWNIADITELVA